MTRDTKQFDYVLMYDGDCLFCNDSVRSIAKRLRNVAVAIIPLQSVTAGKLLEERFKDTPVPDSNILLTQEHTYTKSTGSLILFKYFAWYWQPARIFMWIPRVMRDWVYDRIAANRHHLASKNACVLNSQDNAESVQIFDDRDTIIEPVYKAFALK